MPRFPLFELISLAQSEVSFLDLRATNLAAIDRLTKLVVSGEARPHTLSALANRHELVQAHGWELDEIERIVRKMCGHNPGPSPVHPFARKAA